MSVRLENMAIGYENRKILSDINGSLQPSKINVLLGKNGSGKSTLLKTILRIIPLLSGNIKVDEQDFKSYNLNEYSKKFSVVLSSSIPSIHLTAESFILQGRYPYHNYQLRPSTYEKELIEETVDYLNLGSALPTPISELSDGNFQKVAIARAIVQDTPYIILDEPLSHLDTSNQQIILNVLLHLARKKGKGILFSSHDWNQSLSISDQLWLIKNDTFYAGKTEDLAMQENLISYFSHDDYEYDFCFNQFRKKGKEREGTVQLITEKGSSDAVFWMNRALAKNNFEISNHSEVKIEIRDRQFCLVDKKEEFCSERISDIIDKLKA